MLNSPAPGARFVDPAVLARVGNLELVARSVVDGFINGLHRAPFFGASVDFAEHRGYVPGDDIRRVDWRLFGAHRPLLHQGVRGRLEHELLGAAGRLEVDGVRRAADQARLRQDAGGVPHLPGAHPARPRRSGDVRHRGRSTTCRHRPSTWTSCSTRSIERRPNGRVTSSQPLQKLAEHFGRRGILVVISDFYDEPDADLRSGGADPVPRQ